MNEHVVALARSLKVTRGRKLRTDGTVVETDIHHPSDSSLLFDGVRVLGRAIRRAKEVIQEAGTIFRDRKGAGFSAQLLAFSERVWGYRW